MEMSKTAITASLLLATGGAAFGQWNPQAGDLTKSDATDLRVMTWNVEDGLCSTASKVDGFTSWNALARIVAAIQPDILILQECGDNDGNGTGSFGDSASTLTSVLDIFVHGISGGPGPDPWNAGQQVTSWVQNFAPGYELPYIYVCTVSDNYNRNAILSRYPFADLNGGGGATISSFFMFGDGYAPGSGPGIRGFAVAEIDLPDEVYSGDVVVGNSHLKAGGTTSDRNDRLEASQNIAYFLDYLYNGAGTGTPNPQGNIGVGASTILDENTLIVWGGDLNEDENSNGRRGPAAWMTEAQFAGSNDGTDRDRSDSAMDDARDVFNANARNTQGSSKLDYLLWQESIATSRREFLFNSATVVSGGGSFPSEFTGFPLLGNISSVAADHRPVIVDLIVPLAETGGCLCDRDGNETVDSADFFEFIGAFLAGDADVNGDMVTDSSDFFEFIGCFLAPGSAGC